MSFSLKCSSIGWRIVTVVVIIQLFPTARTASPGDTVPKEIEVGIGDSFSIDCSISNALEATSSPLIFIDYNKNRTIPKEQIKIINSKTIRVTIHNAVDQKEKYQCKRVDGPETEAPVVYVGTPPSNVTDLKCIIYHYHHVNCSFTPPPNNLMVRYKLYLANNDGPFKVNTSCVGPTKTDTVQNWIFNSSCYQPIATKLGFNLIGTNLFGTKSQLYNFSSTEISIPRKLEIKKLSITSNSITLKWEIKDKGFFKKNLTYEIKLQPKNFDWYTVLFSDDEVSCNNRNFCQVTVKNLAYPNRTYNMKVRARLKCDVCEWNEEYVGSFNTTSRSPDFPPKTAVGCFYIDQMRLYWRKLEEYEQNGPKFQYIISDANGKVINTTTDSTIVLPERPKVNSVYYIKANNSDGATINSSIIRVFPNNAPPSYYPTNVAVYHNYTYTLSWKAPKNQEQLMNYTVFWCIHEIGQINMCKGTIHFKYIDKSQTNFTKDSHGASLIMAISANYLENSTGIQWAACYAEVSSDLMQLKPEAKAINSTAIDVKWSIDGVCISIIEGFNLTYCEVVAGNDITTAAASTNCFIKQMPREYKNYTISGLKPYSNYSIEVIVYSLSKKVSPISEALYRETKESAPSKPRNLKFSNVTSNSAFIMWDPPIITNGVIKYYSICYRRLANDSECNDNEPIKTTSLNYTLGSLHSYTNYTVYITAHTVESSEPSESKKFQTLISRPSSPYNITLKLGDLSTLEWENPEVPSGRVELYEIALDLQFTNGDTKQQKLHVKGNKCQFQNLCNMDDLLNYSFSVRAINIAIKDEVDPKVWKALQESNGDTASLANSEDNKIKNFNCSSMVEDSDSVDSLLKSYKAGKKVQIISEWKKISDVNSCRFNNYTGISVAVILVIFFAILISQFRNGNIISAFLRNKWNEWTIGVEIPSGLKDIGTDSWCDNIREKESPDISRTTDWTYKIHICNSPLTAMIPIKSKNNSSSNNESNDDIEKHQQQLLSLEQTSSNDEQSSQSTDSVELNDVSNSSLYSSPMKIKTCDYQEAKLISRPTLTLNTVGGGTDDAYVKPSTIINAAANHPVAIMDNSSIKTFHPTPNGYVRPNTVMRLSSPLHQQHQQPHTNTDGYTTCDVITGGKPSSILISNNISMPSSTTTKTSPMEDSANDTTNKLTSSPTVGVANFDGNTSMANTNSHGNNENSNNNNNNSSLCGYVTQRQLADFGQMLQ